jgi:hypothetical protein
MNEFMTKLFGQSWRTTVGGALSSAQPLIMGAVLAAGYSTPKPLILALSLSSGLGLLILGGTAKDSAVHSTSAQIQASTIENPSIQAAAVAQVKAEPAQGAKP